jgi:hypothetical protein
MILPELAGLLGHGNEKAAERPPFEFSMDVAGIRQNLFFKTLQLRAGSGRGRW